ncbi:MAG: DUF5663 domain-containing protein [Patescibacteria group bacterium]
MSTSTLEQFVNNLLTEKGVTHAEPAVMDEFRADLTTRVSERLNAEMVALLPSEKVEELNDLLDADVEPDTLREFFMTNVPSYQEVFARTLIDFRTSYLS